MLGGFYPLLRIFILFPLPFFPLKSPPPFFLDFPAKEIEAKMLTISLRMSAMSPTGNPSPRTRSFIFWFALECHASTSSRLGKSRSTSSLAIRVEWEAEAEEEEAREAEEAEMPPAEDADN